MRLQLPPISHARTLDLMSVEGEERDPKSKSHVVVMGYRWHPHPKQRGQAAVSSRDGGRRRILLSSFLGTVCEVRGLGWPGPHIIIHTATCWGLCSFVRARHMPVAHLAGQETAGTSQGDADLRRSPVGVGASLSALVRRSCSASGVWLTGF